MPRSPAKTRSSLTAGLFRACSKLTAVAVLFAAFACSKTRKESSAAAGPAVANSSVVADRTDARPERAPLDAVPEDGHCFGRTNPRLDFETWSDAAVQACYPGSARQGPVHTASVTRRQPSAIALPPKLLDTCWIAAVTKVEGESELDFALLDGAAEVHPLGSVRGRRALLPGGGPFCALTSNLGTLRATSHDDVSVVFRIAWYGLGSREDEQASARHLGP